MLLRPAVVTAALATLSACVPGPRGSAGGDGYTAILRVPDNVTVSRAGDQARYSGELTEAGFAALTQLTDGRPIRTLVVNSAGGEIMAGMDFGDWVYERRVDVVVDEMCLSSCANYVFTAARSKLIPSGAVVAWHGSARQRGLRAQLDQVIEGQVKSLGVPPSQQDSERARIQRATADYLERALARQDEFFRRVRVDEHVTRIGNESYGIKGLFYLSVPDMNRFGILNVVAPPNYTQQDMSGLARRSGIPITYLALDDPDTCASSNGAQQASLFALAPVVCGGQRR